MEQIKLKNDTIKEIYQISSNTASTPSTLEISFLNADMTEIETLFKNPENTAIIELLDAGNGKMATFENYTKFNSMFKKMHILTGYTQEETDAEGNITKPSEPIYSDVTTVIMNQMDMIEQLEHLKTQNQQMQAQLDAINKSQEVQDGAILELADMLCEV